MNAPPPHPPGPGQTLGGDWFGPNRGSPSLGSPRIVSPPRQIVSALLNKNENHFSSMRKHLETWKTLRKTCWQLEKRLHWKLGRINWQLGKLIGNWEAAKSNSMSFKKTIRVWYHYWTGDKPCNALRNSSISPWIPSGCMHRHTHGYMQG